MLITTKTKERREAEKLEREILSDFRVYAPANLRIQTQEGKLSPFSLNEVQNVILDIFDDIRARGRLVRVLVLKARREGVSTLITGRNYWRTSTDFNRYAMVITHEPEATDFLFAMVKRYHKHCDELFKPQQKYSNRKLLEFNDPSGPGGLDSAIRVGTAGKEDFGSGQLVHYLHLSEVAKWPANTASDLLTSVLQTVPDDPDTEIIFESTARGIGGEFYLRYWAARYQYDVYLDNGVPKFSVRINEDADPHNKYAAVFIPWYVFSKYRSNVPPEFERTPEEEELVKAYGLTNEQLYWRRDTIANKCDGKVHLFHQEYPSNAREAFISSGQTVFDAVQCEALRKAAPAPIARYEIIPGGGIRPEHEGRFKVWEEPSPTVSYVVAADVAEGLTGGDFSVAIVIEQLSGRQVAEWHGHIAPDLFSDLLLFIGKRYNGAWMVPERNNHGILVVTKLLESRYWKTYAEKQEDPPNRPRRRYGWLTNRKTKPLIVDNLVEAMREGTHGIMSAEIFREMVSFVQHEDGTLGAEEGMHDDRVMAMAIAQFARRKLPLPKPTRAPRPDQPMMSRVRPSSSAWS